MAPVPLTVVSPTVDWIASAVLLFIFGVVVTGYIARHALGELALNRECNRPLTADEPGEVLR
jgi:hypothetical protein